MKFPFTAPTRIVRQAWIENKIDEKWKASRWATRVEARNKVRKIFIPEIVVSEVPLDDDP